MLTIKGPATALRQEVVNGSMHLKDRLSIELQNDLRRGAVRYGNDYISVKVKYHVYWFWSLGKVVDPVLLIMCFKIFLLPENCLFQRL